MMSGSEAAKCVSNKKGTLWEDREVDALIAVMKEYFIMGHVELVVTEDLSKPFQNTYYLLMHVV